MSLLRCVYRDLCSLLFDATRISEGCAPLLLLSSLSILYRKLLHDLLLRQATLLQNRRHLDQLRVRFCDPSRVVERTQREKERRSEGVRALDLAVCLHHGVTAKAGGRVGAGVIKAIRYRRACVCEYV